MTILLYLLILALIAFNLLTIFRKKHPDGQIIIHIDSSGKKIFSLELDKGPEEIENMKNVHFKVISNVDDIAN
ncbi:MAG: hypothetical protein ABWY25_03515 [Paenisporosarcina sp.]